MQSGILPGICNVAIAPSVGLMMSFRYTLTKAGNFSNPKRLQYCLMSLVTSSEAHDTDFLTTQWFVDAMKHFENGTLAPTFYRVPKLKAASRGSTRSMAARLAKTEQGRKKGKSAYERSLEAEEKASEVRRQKAKERIANKKKRLQEKDAKRLNKVKADAEAAIIAEYEKKMKVLQEKLVVKQASIRCIDEPPRSYSHPDPPRSKCTPSTPQPLGRPLFPPRPLSPPPVPSVEEE